MSSVGSNLGLTHSYHSSLLVLPIRIRDPRWVKNKYPGSGMNIPGHISESLETIFWVKNT